MVAVFSDLVKKKHLECVPHQMTESEFWTKFFQSHYFHRDRINLGNKDVFTDCAKQDEKGLCSRVLTVHMQSPHSSVLYIS